MRIVDITPDKSKLAAEVLKVCFSEDPLIRSLFNDDRHYDRKARAFFDSWVKWGIEYGNAWALEDYSGVAIRRRPEHQEIDFWSIMRTGMFKVPVLLGTNRFRRLISIKAKLESEQKQIMKDRPHWYCWMIGVRPEFRGQGLGKQLMNHTFANAERDGVPCYLETSNPVSLRIHESRGFKVQKEIWLDEKLKVFLMIRESQPTAPALEPAA